MSGTQRIEHAAALLDTVGNTEHVFDRHSIKSRDELLQEVACKEATLHEVSSTDLVTCDVIARYGHLQQGDPATRWLKRLAWSSKLIIRTDQEFLLEKCRIYPGAPERPVVKQIYVAGMHIPLPPNWTFSETSRAEDPLVAILRALAEEMGIQLLSPVLRPLHPGKPTVDTHVSSVYHKIVTQNLTTWYEWVIPERFGPSIIERKDHAGPNAATLVLEWTRC